MHSSRTTPAPRVLFASAEAFPLAKTGGLGDVAAALPPALAGLGVDVRIVLPAYPQALELIESRRVVSRLALSCGGGVLIEGRMPDTGVHVYLYDAPALFRRRGSLYQDRWGNDWPDNHLRFGSFCHAIAAISCGKAGLDWQPHIVHANDWHTGLVPALLAGDTDSPATLFTIHNMAFQGNFPLCVGPDLGLPACMLASNELEFFGQLSFLKAGLRYGDRLTTVSPNYAREILTPENGFGFEGLLNARKDDLVGILNGVDYNVWDPAVDRMIAKQYTADDVSGKAACKAAIQAELGLERSDAPLIIFVNRIAHQKMADVVLAALPALLQEGRQFVLHGQGEKSLERAFEVAASGYPGRVAVRIGYDESLARRLTAAADMSLTASRFEPCGLTTMYAMRYGALPVTRLIGGLVDTVVDAGSPESGGQHGTGFVFDTETPEEMARCVHRACQCFEGHHWRSIQQSAMRRDFGWKRSAQRYTDLYLQLITDKDRREADETSVRMVA